MEKNRLTREQARENNGTAEGTQPVISWSKEESAEGGGQRSKKFQMTRMTFTVYRFHINRHDDKDDPEAAGVLVKPRR
ncbi:hypothetical protein DUZ99_03460 [Xylanibacillus composti]|uniref:Uncharacterized protein n=1 Tax=Xylanibacillus composti TaxID=1572762 RepID=A0A8J4H4P4_9BACL|nr:hypothetical protein [Xylanibacillus composti]MDT9724058.1 hypothetical protein [Xylanibacillus composti]GIQ69451.1 hypothetical protein XYCOK13_22750 [Xylanibacillus composti]